MLFIEKHNAEKKIIATAFPLRAEPKHFHITITASAYIEIKSFFFLVVCTMSWFKRHYVIFYD